MRGDVANSPFVSVCLDHASFSTSTDPWARCIASGLPELSWVARAPDIGEFAVPSRSLLGPQTALSHGETECVYEGSDLIYHLVRWQRNLY
jgi:hypothetical protein